MGFYDAHRTRTDEKDFHSNVTTLQLGGIRNEIIDMLKRFELPDEFKGKKEWIAYATKLR